MIALLKRLAATVFAGGYTLSPIDFIPDVIPVLGQADDLAVILALIFYWYSLTTKDRSHTAPGDAVTGQIIDIKPVE